jgi:hypothetical protein
MNVPCFLGRMSKERLYFRPQRSIGTTGAIEEGLAICLGQTLHCKKDSL